MVSFYFNLDSSLNPLAQKAESNGKKKYQKRRREEEQEEGGTVEITSSGEYLHFRPPDFKESKNAPTSGNPQESEDPQTPEPCNLS